MTSHNGPQRLGDIKGIVERIANFKDAPEVTPERREAILATRRQQKAAVAERELFARIGKRYADATLESFRAGDDEHTNKRIEVKRKVATFLMESDGHIRAGGNVLICGPPGTGKDHLLCAMLRQAIQDGHTVQWWNGQSLFRQFRDQIDSTRSEGSFLTSFLHADVLAISDPVPPKGNASDYAAHMLYQIVDQRYGAMKSTWVTANMATKQDAQDALSAPIFDRLLDNAFTVFCNWPSFRQSRKPEWLK